jgi:hypothetical protein
MNNLNDNSNENLDHSSHNSRLNPVKGCPDCDREINRPLVRRFGLGSSSLVIPRVNPEENSELGDAK